MPEMKDQVERRREPSPFFARRTGRTERRQSEASRRETTESHPAITDHFDPVREGAGEEPNIIIIAHPGNRMLGNRYRLSPGTVLEIGRSGSSEVSFPDVSSISRVHARLSYVGGTVLLEDLQSMNGTYVNDRRIAEAAKLRSGDRFQIGAVHFKFLHEKDVETAYHFAIFDLVTRDGLTAIYNKRKFDEEFDREFGRARRYERPLALISMDIDHFKEINDSLGHLAGDSVLKQVCDRLASLLRREQIFARIGGEEFAVLCPETDLESAMILAEKLRERIAREPCSFSDAAVPVTASFGVAAIRPEMSGPTDLTGEADRALYASKSAGRNRVTSR